MLRAGCEPRSYGVGSDCSANCAATTAQTHRFHWCANACSYLVSTLSWTTVGIGAISKLLCLKYTKNILSITCMATLNVCLRIGLDPMVCLPMQIPSLLKISFKFPNSSFWQLQRILKRFLESSKFVECRKDRKVSSLIRASQVQHKSENYHNQEIECLKVRDSNFSKVVVLILLRMCFFELLITLNY